MRFTYQRKSKVNRECSLKGLKSPGNSPHAVGKREGGSGTEAQLRSASMQCNQPTTTRKRQNIDYVRERERERVQKKTEMTKIYCKQIHFFYLFNH